MLSALLLILASALICFERSIVIENSSVSPVMLFSIVTSVPFEIYFPIFSDASSGLPLVFVISKLSSSRAFPMVPIISGVEFFPDSVIIVCARRMLWSGVISSIVVSKRTRESISLVDIVGTDRADRHRELRGPFKHISIAAVST